MVRERSIKYFLADTLIYIVLALILLSCVLPFLHILSVSFSGRTAVTANRVGLWPVDFSLDNYGAVATKDRFLLSFFVSVARVGIAVPSTLLIVVLTAYPLALDRIRLPGRKVFLSVLILANLFDVGLIPRYLTYRDLGLIDNFAVLILPTLLATMNVILVINFFRGIPYELVESAMLDGANHWDILLRVMVPLSKPVLATIALFTFVRHWNSWFDGIVYLRDVKMWPLQSYLYSVLTTQEVQGEFAAYRFSGLWPNVSPHGAEAAMVFFAILPIVIVYPFLQRYFISGMKLGAVKE
jgi:putative aldouronate transport system permease protein